MPTPNCILSCSMRFDMAYKVKAMQCTKQTMAIVWRNLAAYTTFPVPQRWLHAGFMCCMHGIAFVCISMYVLQYV